MRERLHHFSQIGASITLPSVDSNDSGTLD
jgi:hypothetical protein